MNTRSIDIDLGMARTACTALGDGRLIIYDPPAAASGTQAALQAHGRPFVTAILSLAEASGLLPLEQQQA